MDSTSINKDWIDLLARLNAGGVRYLIVGAYALACHAAPRATGDIDIFVDRSSDNAMRIFRVLAEFGAPLGDLVARDFESDDLIFMFGVQPLRVDVLTDISGVSFSEAWVNSIEGLLGGIPVRFIGRDEYLKNKRASGRLKDLADIEAVESFEGKPPATLGRPS